MRNNGAHAMLWSGVLVALALGACMFFVMRTDVKSAEPVKKPAPVRTRDLGEGIVLSQHGLYGVSLVKIGKAHLRKLRKGPFTIGAINELVLEDVELTLPEELWRGVSGADTTESSRQEGAGDSKRSGADVERSRPAAMLAKLGLKPEHLKLDGRLPRFSALCIQNLKVTRLEGTNAAPWFVAREANAERGGLALEDGWSVDDGRRVDWPEARLVFDPELRVVPRRP